MAHVHCGSSHNSNSPPALQARHTSSYASDNSCSCPAAMERCSSRVSRSRAARSVAWKSAPVRQLSGCSVRHIGHLPASFAAFQVLPMQSRWNMCVHDSETVGRGVPCNGSRQTAHVADDVLWLDAATRFSPAIGLVHQDPAPARCALHRVARASATDCRDCSKIRQGWHQCSPAAGTASWCQPVFVTTAGASSAVQLLCSH